MSQQFGNNRLMTEEARKQQENDERWIKGVGFFIVVAVAGYAEVAFLSIIGSIFPDNPISRDGAIIGAVATGASCCLLVAAKLKWIRTGSQSKWSWLFLVVEIGIMGANTMLAYQLSKGHVADWMSTYYQISPATPLLAFTGWILLFMTDHKKAIEDKRRAAIDAMTQAEAEHELEQHTVLLALKRDILHVQADHMRKEVEMRRPEIERATSMLVSAEISALLGSYIPPTSSGKMVQGSGQALPLLAPAPLTQTASVSTPVPVQPGPGVVEQFKSLFHRTKSEQPSEPAPAAHVARGGGRYVPATPEPAVQPPARRARPESAEEQRKARREREARYHVKPAQQEQAPDPQQARRNQQSPQSSQETTGTKKKPKKDLPPMNS